MTEAEPATAYIGLGSNLGDRAGRVREALSRLDGLAATELVDASRLYETQPRLIVDQPDFVNACVKIRTRLPARKLLDALLAIEQAMGRVREVDKGPRSIDLDLLLYDDLVVDTPGLTLPHPGLPDRGFVLVPLAEIAAELVHPTLGQTVAELVAACPDAGWVRSLRSCR